MKKSVIGGICAAAMLSVAAFGMTACGSKHSHTIASEWSFDQYYHYHEASCNSVNHREDVAEHEGDVCFCGYNAATFGKPSDGDGDGAGNDDGESNFGSLTLTRDGVLEFNKVKGAVKYVLSLTYSGADRAVTFDVDKKDNKINLDELTGGFPSGKTQAQLTAWEKYSEKVDGETIETEAPMDGVSDSFRIIKLNGEYELVRLNYKDDFVELNGFTYDGDAGNYNYEFVLTNNTDTRFNISAYVKAASGGAVRFYRSESDRESGDNALSSNDLLFQSVHHGENMFYAEAVVGGQGKFYDLCIYGLYKLEVDRYTVSYTENADGIRNFAYNSIGETIAVTERDIITRDRLFDGVDDDYIGRDGAYEIIERGDLLITSDSPRVKLYFYDEDEVRADCDEYAQVAETFSVSDNEMYISLYAGYGTQGEMTVPFTVAGKIVARAQFVNSDVTVVRVGEGATAFVCSFQDCGKITDIYLPSTITQMERFSFGQSYYKLAESVTIHCAFDRATAQGFSDDWNKIDGTFNSYYTTIYDDSSTPSGPSDTAYTVDGVKYVIEGGSAAVVDTTKKFNGVIPDEVRLGDNIYRVTAIKSMGVYSDVTIGGNVQTIEKNAFGRAVKSLAVSPHNTAFTVIDGILCSSDLTRIIIAETDLEYAFISSQVTEIDKYAFSLSSDGISLFFENDDGNDFGISTVNCNVNRGVSSVCVNNVRYAVFATNDYRDAEACIVDYVGGSAAELIIPETVSGAKVTEVYTYGALAACTDVSRICLPFALAKNDSTWRMMFGTDAQPNIREIEFTGSISDVYDFASLMPDYNSIERIIIPENNGWFISADGVIFNADMTRIDYITPTLTHLTIPSGVIYIAALPSSLESVVIESADVFVHLAGLANLRTVTLADGITEIDSSAFADCQALREITLPNTLKKIGDFAFNNCRSLENVTLPSGLEVIGISAFADCRKLKSIVIPASIVTVGRDAFAGCTSLESVTVPNTITTFNTFSSGTFKYCGKLKTIKFDGTKKQFDAIFKSKDGYHTEGLTDGSYVLKIVCSDGEVEVERT